MSTVTTRYPNSRRRFATEPLPLKRSKATLPLVGVPTAANPKPAERRGAAAADPGGSVGPGGARGPARAGNGKSLPVARRALAAWLRDSGLGPVVGWLTRTGGLLPPLRGQDRVGEE